MQTIYFKAFAFFTLSVLYFMLQTSVAFAQTASSAATTNYQPISTAQLTAPTSPHSASLAIYNFGHALSCILIGQSSVAPCLEYQAIKDTRGMIHSVPVLSSVNTNSGALGMSMSMVGEIIGKPPIRSSEFIADMGKQLGIKQADAQVGGSGGGVLTPIFKLWEVSRNIAYLAMIIIFLLVGLMVMFRQKLNPQTVVSIQMALPGLVIGLVMITFSYFLAALISDMAFVGTNLVGYYFSLADPAITEPTQLPLIENSKSTIGGLATTGQEANVLTIFSRYTGIMSTRRLWTALDSIWPYLNDPNRGDFPLIGGFLGITWQGMDPQQAISLLANIIAIQFLLPFGSLFGGKGQAVAAAAPVLVTTFLGSTFLIAYSLSWVAMIALVYSMFRLLLKLISNLLSIIFLTITAPFFFLAASLPGRQGLVNTWIFNMLCNVLAFPAVFAVFYFVAFMLKGQTSNGTEPLFAVGLGASVTGSTTFPLLGGLSLDFLNVLIAFGALMALPSVPDIICRAVGKPSQLGGLAAGAISGAIAGGQRYQGQVQSGSSGLAGNIGRLSDQPGYIVKPVDTGGGKFRYEFHKPESETEGRLASGVQRGQWSKFTEGVSEATRTARRRFRI